MPNDRPPKIAWFLLIFLAAAGMAGCAPVVERVHLRLDSTLNVDVSGTLSIPVAQEGDLPEKEACFGTPIRRRVEGGRGYYSVQRESVSSSDFRDLQKCLIDVDALGIQTRRTENLFYIRYGITLKLFESPQNRTRQQEIGRIQYLPSTINIAMPGNRMEIEDVSARRVAQLDIDRVAPAEANVALRIPDGILRQALQEYENLCPAGASDCPARRAADPNGWPTVVPVILEIRSTEYKYGLSELIAALAVFGSGLALGAGKWMESRRRKRSLKS